MRQGLTDGAPFAQECLGLGGEISLSKPFEDVVDGLWSGVEHVLTVETIVA